MITKRVSIVPAEGTWVVRAGGAVIGETNSALELVIGESKPQIYFPRDDIGMAFLDKSKKAEADQDLGKAEFFGIVTRSTVIQDAAWSYTSSDAGRIENYLAFDTDRVTVEEV